MRRKQQSGWVRVLAGLALASASTAGAATITSGNSSLTFNPVSTKGQIVPHYITSWNVDGVEEFGGPPAGSEDFSVAFNQGGGADLNETKLTDSSASGNTFTADYDLGGFIINYKAVLTGGALGSGTSSFQQTVTFTNGGSSATPLTVDFGDTVQYNVDGTTTGNVLNLSPSTSPDSATQTSAHAKITFTASKPSDLFFTSPDAGQTPSSTNTGPITGTPQFTLGWETPLSAGDSTTLIFTETLTGGSISKSGGPGPSTVPLPNSAAAVLTTLAGLAGIASIRRRGFAR